MNGVSAPKGISDPRGVSVPKGATIKLGRVEGDLNVGAHARVEAESGRSKYRDGSSAKETLSSSED